MSRVLASHLVGGLSLPLNEEMSLQLQCALLLLPSSSASQLCERSAASEQKSKGTWRGHGCSCCRWALTEEGVQWVSPSAFALCWKVCLLIGN